jgi:hypothetical protein
LRTSVEESCVAETQRLDKALGASRYKHQSVKHSFCGVGFTVRGSELKLTDLVEPKQTVEKRRQIDQERIGQPEDKVLDTVDCSSPEFVIRICKECHALLHPRIECVCLALLAEGVVVVFAYKNECLRGLRIQRLSKQEGGRLCGVVFFLRIKEGMRSM